MLTSNILCRAASDPCDYIFGDYVTQLLFKINWKSCRNELLGILSNLDFWPIVVKFGHGLMVGQKNQSCSESPWTFWIEKFEIWWFFLVQTKVTTSCMSVISCNATFRCTTQLPQKDNNISTATIVLRTFISSKIVVIQIIINVNSMARTSKNGKGSVAVFLLLCFWRGNILIRVNKYNLWVPPEAKLFFVHG